MLSDNLKRYHDYLRISVTDKCNLRCRYCMPPDGVRHLPHDEVLRNEEFVRLIDIFLGMGIKKIRFTGGEPLLRKGLMDIISETRKRDPAIELCVTSNGVLIGGFIDRLYELGVKKINISLDTLSRERYAALTGSDSFDAVTANIDKLLEYDFFDVKINAVLFDETLSEVDAFLDYFSRREVSLRFIEMMPFSGAAAANEFLRADRFVDELSKRGDLVRKTDFDTNVAMMYLLHYKNNKPLKIGVIPPVTHKFCSACNRLRLTSDGYMKTCLHSNRDYDIKGALRSGGDGNLVVQAIKDALSEKASGHDIDCWFEGGGCSSLQFGRKMSQIGG